MKGENLEKIYFIETKIVRRFSAARVMKKGGFKKCNLVSRCY
jgi:hypothetical protein